MQCAYALARTQRSALASIPMHALLVWRSAGSAGSLRTMLALILATALASPPAHGTLPDPIPAVQAQRATGDALLVIGSGLLAVGLGAAASDAAWRRGEVPSARVPIGLAVAGTSVAIVGTGVGLRFRK